MKAWRRKFVSLEMLKSCIKSKNKNMKKEKRKRKRNEEDWKHLNLNLIEKKYDKENPLQIPLILFLSSFPLPLLVAVFNIIQCLNYKQSQCLSWMSEEHNKRKSFLSSNPKKKKKVFINKHFIKCFHKEWRRYICHYSISKANID